MHFLRALEHLLAGRCEGIFLPRWRSRTRRLILKFAQSEHGLVLSLFERERKLDERFLIIALKQENMDDPRWRLYRPNRREIATLELMPARAMERRAGRVTTSPITRDNVIEGFINPDELFRERPQTIGEARTRRERNETFRERTRREYLAQYEIAPAPMQSESRAQKVKPKPKAEYQAPKARKILLEVKNGSEGGGIKARGKRAEGSGTKDRGRPARGFTG